MILNKFRINLKGAKLKRSRITSTKRCKGTKAPTHIIDSEKVAEPGGGMYGLAVEVGF